jgi:hypothetical protein
MSEWISVKDRMPKNEQWVWATLDSKQLVGAIFLYNRFTFARMSCDKGEVTHWLPNTTEEHWNATMPEPPQV